MLDANAERAHILGEPGEIHRIVGPQFPRFDGLLAAVGSIETAFRLIAATVVVDDRDRRKIPTHCGFHFRDVVPEAGVTGENNHRTLLAGSLGAYARGKCPAKMAGAA